MGLIPLGYEGGFAAFRKNIYRTTAHLINVKKNIPFSKFFFDHLAILKETSEEVELIAIRGNDSFRTDLNNLNIYKIKVNLRNGLITNEQKLLEIENNLRALDVLVNEEGRIFISYLFKNDQEESVKVIELLIKNDKYETSNLFTSTSIKSTSGTNIQSGGKMIQINKNEILFAIGDFGKGGKENLYSNYLNTDLGKTFLINIDTKKSKIFTKGHRNPQGLVKSKNYIIETEHGPEGGDEINFLELGKNYGWPHESYGAQYNEFIPESSYPTVFGSHDNYTKPIYAFIPSVGIKAIEQLPESQTEFPNWKNNFLICSSKGIHRVEILFDPNPRVIFSSLLADKITFEPPSKKVESCRDLQITSDGIIITNGGLIISRKKALEAN